MDHKLYDLELLIAKLLRAGVLVAGFLLLAGWVSHLQLVGNPLLGFATYQKHPFVESVRSAWGSGAWGVLVSYLGLVVLIALPFTRVLMTAVLFLKQRERTLAGVAAFVAVALVVSILLGFEI